MRHGSSKVFERDKLVLGVALLAACGLGSASFGCEASDCGAGLTRLDGLCLPVPRDASIEPSDAGDDDASTVRDAGSADASLPDAGLPDASSPSDGGADADTPCGLLSFFEDRDRDGHGSPAHRVDACKPPPGYVAVGDDCDDGCAECKPGGNGMCTAASADFSCTTSCGSTGIGTCASSCELNCVAPPETCNYVDDDCDGSADEALRKLSVSPFRERASVRSWLFAQGGQPISFVQLPPSTLDGRSELRARRLNADGTVVDADASIMNVALASAEYALAATGDKVVIVWGEIDPLDPLQTLLRGSVLARSDLTELVAPRTLATAQTIRHPVAAATAAGVLVVFSTSDGIVRVLSDGSLNGPSAPQRVPDSGQGRAHVIATNRGRNWLMAYPSSSGLAPTDLHLQLLAADGAALGAAVNATHSRMNAASSPSLAEDGAGNLALTFHEQDVGELNLVLFRQTDLRQAELTPFSSSVVSNRAGACATDACRSSAVAFTRGYWTVSFAVRDDVHGHSVQARMIGARGALGPDGSPALTLATDAGEVFAPSIATLDSGVTAFVTSAGPNTRYARWGCP